MRIYIIVWLGNSGCRNAARQSECLRTQLNVAVQTACICPHSICRHGIGTLGSEAPTCYPKVLGQDLKDDDGNAQRFDDLDAYVGDLQ